MFAKGYQSRKFLLTINNPESAGMTHEEIIDRAQKFNPDYFCMADEIGASGTYHTHVYLYSDSPMRFETVKKRFPTAHIDKAAGSSRSNRDYIRKEGKWADTDKADTRVEGSFKEFGTIPDESEEGSQNGAADEVYSGGTQQCGDPADRSKLRLQDPGDGSAPPAASER